MAGRLVDVLPARSAVAVTDWLASKPAPWLEGIRHVVIDPYQPYATAVAQGLPDELGDVSTLADPSVVEAITAGAQSLDS